MNNISKKKVGILLFVFVITFLFIFGLWYYVTSVETKNREIILTNWNQLQMSIVKEAAIASQEWINLRIKEQGIPKAIVEQEVFKKFIDPIRILKSGDAFIYNKNYVIFDESKDFPNEYKHKGIGQIYQMQKSKGASHMEDLVYGIENATQNTGWYIWLPDKGREFVAWTSVRLDDDTWTIGLSTPEKEIFESADLYNQKNFVIFSCVIISILLFLLGVIISIQIIKSSKRMYLLEETVRKRTAELEHANQMLSKEIIVAKNLSIYDKLTGIYNRRYFEKQIIVMDMEKSLPISVIMGDVNGLKLVNDAFGHSKGDNILKRIAQIIKLECGEEICVARHGGDEFAAILPGVNYDEANLIVSRIKKRCEEESTDELMLHITFGVGTKTEEEQQLIQCQNLAEERMYTSKLLEGKNIRSTIIENLRLVLEEKTGETRKHCERMSEMAQLIGEDIRLQSYEIENLKLLSLLHDIGKTAISDIIILKPGKLDESEIAIMQKHSEIGYRIANTMPELIPIAEGVLHHHERWDGKGYPQGLVGDEIPLMSRIVAILDAYDAMTHDRPYRKAIGENEAIDEIKRCSGTQFDPNISKIFIEKVLRNDMK